METAIAIDAGTAVIITKETILKICGGLDYEEPP